MVQKKKILKQFMGSMSRIKVNKKNNLRIVGGIFGFVIVVMLSWSFIKMNDPKEITKTYICDIMPIVKTDGNVIPIQDSVAVIYYKNYALYEFEEACMVYDDTILVKRTIENRYLLHNKKELYGYYYDAIDAKIGKRVRVDSILKKRAGYGQSFYFPTKMVLIDSQKNKGGYELIEKYKCKAKIDFTYPDTLIVYYTNKLKHVDFTLSKILDSVKKIKVQKTRVLFNPQFIGDYPNKYPAYEFKRELKEDTVSNLEKYKHFINEKTKTDQ